VVSTTNDTANNQAQGVVHMVLHVDVSDAATGNQVADIVAHYLRNLEGGTYTGYRVELDVRQDENHFTVDSGRLPITNNDQIIQQADDWVALRHEFPTATVKMRATIVHPNRQEPVQDEGHSNIGILDLSDPADYEAVSAAAHTLSGGFGRLAGLDWTIDAGKEHPAEIKTSRRLPTNAEIDVWNQLNADQSIPHIDRLRINGPVTPPVWISEKTIQSRDVAVALQLARSHLPIAAELAAPVLYTAGDQLSGHIGGRGFARGPVAVTIGGCTKHDPLVYVPIPEERKLIGKYEICSP